MTKELCVWEDLPQSLSSPCEQYPSHFPFRFSKRNDPSQHSLSYFTNGNNGEGKASGREEFGEKVFLRVQPGPGESAGPWPCHQRPHERGRVSLGTGIFPLLSGGAVPNTALSGIPGP